MNQEQYFAAYKGRKIVIYPTASLFMCRFTLKSPAEIPFDIGDTFGLDVIGAGPLAFVGDKDDLWCIVPKMDEYKILPILVIVYHIRKAIDQLDNRHRPMYHSHIITAWQNIKAHVWAFLKRRKYRETIQQKTHSRRRRRGSRLLP